MTQQERALLRLYWRHHVLFKVYNHPYYNRDDMQIVTETTHYKMWCVSVLFANMISTLFRETKLRKLLTH